MTPVPVRKLRAATLPIHFTRAVALVLIACIVACDTENGPPPIGPQDLAATEVFYWCQYCGASDTLSLKYPVLLPQYIKLRWTLSTGTASFNVAYTGPDSKTTLVRFNDQVGGWHDSWLGDWTPTGPGRFVFRAVMDPTNEFPETDETNNEDSLVVWIIP